LHEERGPQPSFVSPYINDNTSVSLKLFIATVGTACTITWFVASVFFRPEALGRVEAKMDDIIKAQNTLSHSVSRIADKIDQHEKDIRRLKRKKQPVWDEE
jgi:hypothetical protein